MNQVQVVTSEVILSVGEQHELYQLEGVIKHGLDTFQEVGEALATIRDKRLYRADYGNFAEYTREKWGLGKSRAYQLIQGAEIAGQLSTAVDTLQPENERQIRPLDKLAPELRSAAWAQAVSTAEGDQPTADQVEAIVDKMLGKAGRFDPIMFYVVIHRQHIVYNRTFADFKAVYADLLLTGCDVEKGERLNNQRNFDAYALVEVPELDNPPIDEVISLVKDAYYPVDKKQRIIYNEPILSWDMRSERRYPEVEWIAEGAIRRLWQSIAARLCEYRIEPPVAGSLEWVTDASLKPGLMARCYKCKGKDYSFEQWTPSDIAETWACPEGHFTRDNYLSIVTHPLPVTPPDAPIADADDSLDLDSDLQDILLSINVFSELLETIIDTPEQVEDALTPENLEIIKKDYLGADFQITDKVVEAVKHLLTWFGNTDAPAPSGDSQE